MNNENVFGYARVSSREQNEDRQIIALKELGVPEEHIYIDKQYCCTDNYNIHFLF